MTSVLPQGLFTGTTPANSSCIPCAAALPTSCLTPLAPCKRRFLIQLPEFPSSTNHVSCVAQSIVQNFGLSCHNLPIVEDGNNGFRLDPVVADAWMNLENCLHAVGSAMLEVAPQRGLRRLVNPRFFPGRFKFLRKYPTKQAARTGAWYSIDNFLPLLGYVSMGFWFMQSEENVARSRSEEPPDWRQQVAEKTAIHQMFLDYLVDSIKWNDECVGTLYCIQSPTDFRPEEREQRAEIEWLLASILPPYKPRITG
ncbi:hypothetical protein B0H13DRAFT_1886297 [Mycena leptocephala]|nr:hypothetical protein B0H13DRAFT_1886297 [Mycena leptocephala]